MVFVMVVVMVCGCVCVDKFTTHWDEEKMNFTLQLFFKPLEEEVVEEEEEDE